MSSYADLPRISLAAALAEPEHERLDFTRRSPSPETAAALARAAKPELLASDMRQMRARKRPRAA